MADIQCKAVIFGGSADNGYARLLQPYVDNSKSKRLILIEGPPFAKELAVLKDRFLVARFPQVFRNTRLQSSRLSFLTTPPPTPIPKAPNYAATIVSPVDAAVVRTDDAFHLLSTTVDPRRREYPVLKNSKGQRLDAIISPPQSLVHVMRTKKICNAFHLLGECSSTKCAFLHGVRLDDREIEARRWIVRQVPCLSGLQCKDEKCLLGHQCHDVACAKIGRGCRFSKKMHNIDRT